ncbi:MAG: acyl-CoA thioesterase [Candidatus Binatia bacterium]
MKETETIIESLTSYRVIYGDTDQMGVVYYANYLRWFEMGRTEFLRRIEMPYTSVEEMGLRFPVIEVSCHYHKPARFDDLLTIATTLTSLGRASLTFSYRIRRDRNDPPLATGWTKHACVDQHGEAIRVPADLERVLKESVSRTGKTTVGKPDS